MLLFILKPEQTQRDRLRAFAFLVHLCPIGPWAPLEWSRRGREQQRFQRRLVQFLVKRPGQPCGLGTFEIEADGTVRDVEAARDGTSAQTGFVVEAKHLMDLAHR